MTVRVIAQLRSENFKGQEGIQYRIDLGVDSKPDEDSLQHFVEVHEVCEDNVVRYHAGGFGDYLEAIQYKKYVEDLGFGEATVTAFYNRQEIPLEDAIVFQSNMEGEGETTLHSRANDIYWKSLQYEIQIGVYTEEQDVKKFMALGNVRTRIADGHIYYTYGEFPTYLEAKLGKHDVLSAGFKDAFLIALLDGEKVLVEEAIIFEAFREQLRQDEDENMSGGLPGQLRA